MMSTKFKESLCCIAVSVTSGKKELLYPCETPVVRSRGDVQYGTNHWINVQGQKRLRCEVFPDVWPSCVENWFHAH